MSQEKVKKARPLRCIVTSDHMEKSRVGVVERTVRHPRYHKHIRRRTKVMFHDEKNQSKLGDVVLVSPSRPHSKRKTHDLLKVVELAKD